jgi:hypothetical protein
MPWNWIGRLSLASPDRFAELREQTCSKLSVPFSVIYNGETLIAQRVLSSRAGRPSWMEDSEVSGPLELDTLLGSAT